MLEASQMIPLGDEIQLAKGFKEVLSVYKSKLSGSLAREETAALIAKMRSGDAYAMFGDKMDSVLRRTEKLPAVDALNSVKVFRLLPPPDILQTYALLKRWRESCCRRSVGPALIATFKENLREVILSALVRNPATRPGPKDAHNLPVWWADYLRGHIDQIPHSELAEVLDWEGSMTIPVRSRYNPKVWKDSGIGADTLEEASMGNTPADKKSMLLRMLYDHDCPMPDSRIRV